MKTILAKLGLMVLWAAVVAVVVAIVDKAGYLRFATLFVGGAFARTFAEWALPAIKSWRAQ